MADRLYIPEFHSEDIMADIDFQRASFYFTHWGNVKPEPEGDCMLDKLKRYRDEFGRSDLPFEIHAISLDGFDPEGIKRLEAMGVTDVIVGFRNVYQMEQDTESLQQKIDALSHFAENTINTYRNG